jgi:CubicO group peptidase (beta-lactamase class C family)
VQTQLDVAGFARSAGLDGLPLAIAAHGPDGLVVDHVEGRWSDGEPVVRSDRFYGASLTKQLTGTAIALLSQRGLLEVDAPLGRYIAELPPWRDKVTLRQLLHHTAGLPEASAIELGDTHWTNERALALLRDLGELPFAPGAAERYSNLGYVYLAAIIEAVSGLSFARFVADNITGSLALDGMAIWDDDGQPPHRQILGMGPGLPLSTGDGGLWTTASGFARWLDSQNRDRLVAERLVQQPGRLSDGSATDYGWGIGLRTFRGHPLFIHGGSWHGAAAKAVRCPALGLSVVALSTDNGDAVNALVDMVLGTLADGLTPRGA